MGVYLLIETRSSWESPEVDRFLEVATALVGERHQVDLYLVQNGVLNARAGANGPLAPLIEAHAVPIWVDEFSLNSRALSRRDLMDGVDVTGIDQLVELLTRPGCKPIWH